MPDKEDLRSLLINMNDREFLELIKVMATESEQFLNVMEMGDGHSIPALFENILATVLGKVTMSLEAEAACLMWIRGGRLETVLKTDKYQDSCRDLAERAAERAEIVNASGDQLGPEIRSVLCVPMRSRNQEFRAVAQLVNKLGAAGFTPADERTFRDFAGPLGMILECWQRVAHRNPFTAARVQGAT